MSALPFSAPMPDTNAAIGLESGVADDAQTAPRRVVLDTNIVLDVLLFQAPEAEPLRAALQAGQVQWLATAHMREELRRVLDYAHIAPRVQFYGTTAEQILARRDQWVRPVEAAPPCVFVCRDADDQCFIDLAVAHGALLLSKDAQVLKLRKRLARQGVVVSRSFVPVA
ncbi:MAG: putative toxin-antitoxin system toxin component, PIN family [Brachymonas sp.]|nr:putative toxin-antitoxin system toxin component, PIN family [Brachymonas sp.]